MKLWIGKNVPVTCGNVRSARYAACLSHVHRYPDSRGPLAQWQSCGLLIVIVIYNRSKDTGSVLLE